MHNNLIHDVLIVVTMIYDDLSVNIVHLMTAAVIFTIFQYIDTKIGM